MPLIFAILYGKTVKLKSLAMALLFVPVSNFMMLFIGPVGFVNLTGRSLLMFEVGCDRRGGRLFVPVDSVTP